MPLSFSSTKILLFAKLFLFHVLTRSHPILSYFYREQVTAAVYPSQLMLIDNPSTQENLADNEIIMSPREAGSGAPPRLFIQMMKKTQRQRGNFF